MLDLFSSDKRFKTWRLLWIALAEAEKELGIAITDEQIEELKRFKDDINYATAEKKERQLKHDVMAHIYAYGEQCPKAAGIIHFGATSCYVTDNADIIIMRDALNLISKKVLTIIKELSAFALKYKNMPCLGFTHFQPAQLVTVGKRACMWIQDLLMDYEDISYVLSTIKLLGNKGTTGTQASFLKIFDGDNDKVIKLEQLISSKMGFANTFPVSGQTYPRKTDSRIINVLSGIAESAGKFSNDMRLLQGMKELEEPFDKSQVGSSAMAYKRNPMRCERISSLSRYVIVNSLGPQLTAYNQWLERTLDDSANRRITIPEVFLAVDSILNIFINVSQGIVVYPKMIEKHIKEELPFIETENILMTAVKKNGNRQMLHERLREHSMEAGKRIKLEGLDNDLLIRISNDDEFNLSSEELKSAMSAEGLAGRAAAQVDEFIESFIQPVIKNNQTMEGSFEFKF